MTKNNKLKFFAWGLSLAVSFLAIFAWGDSYAWQLSRLSIYQIFPLLGLLAFSLMWSHYVVSALRRYMDIKRSVLQGYFEATAAVVLSLIVLHPGLLAWQLWLDGKGLPPASELNYVVASARWAILFGFVALSMFLLYELRRVYAKTDWWKFVQYASDVAMILIFFHALKLGGALQADWFRAIWYLYGISLIGAQVYVYIRRQGGEKSNQA